jgi:DNA invertase Pin-like site-specific DNA recombinase
MVPTRATTNAEGDRRKARSARVRIGYGRVSTRDQHLEAQHDALTAAGCEQVYVDVASGKLAARPELDKTLVCLREGDTLVITRLDRLGRSLPHLLDVSAELRERNVDVIVLQQQIDTSTAAGRMFFAVLGAVGEFERDLLSERTRDGLRAARARGRTGGRTSKLKPAEVRLARQMRDDLDDNGRRRHTVQDIADEFDVSRGTIYRALNSAPRPR